MNSDCCCRCLRVAGINSVAETCASQSQLARSVTDVFHEFREFAIRQRSAARQHGQVVGVAAAGRDTATVHLSINRTPRPAFEETTKCEYSSSLLLLLYQ